MSKRRGKRRQLAARSHSAKMVAAAPAAPAAAAAPVEVPRRPAGETVRALVAHRAFPFVTLVVLYGVSVVVYSVIASAHLLPDLFPDEVFYTKLSQSFAAGHGLEWRGSSWGLPPLWPVILSVVWHFGSTPDGYMLAKVLGAALASATVFPVWLLAREFVGPRLALLPAFLCIALPSMETTAFLVSDNLAYPLGTASLACTVMAVRTTRVRWIGLSLAFAAVATLVRTQMLVLPVILLLALALDVVRQPHGQRRARLAAWPRALWIALGAGVVALLLAFIVKPDLTNYAILAHHVGLGHALKITAQHALSSILMFAVIPIAIVGAMMSRAANWRDDRSGPVLTVLAAAVIVLYPVVGRFEAYATSAPVDRYVIYLAPLIFLAFTLAPGRIDRVRGIIAGSLTVLLLLLAPLATNAIEQPALWGIQQTLRNIGLGSTVKAFTCLVVLPLVAVAVLALTSRLSTGRALALATAASVAVMFAASWTSQKSEIDVTHAVRYQAAPRQLEWVDSRVNGDVATLNLGEVQRLRHNYNLYTDLFNKRVTEMYSTLSSGGEECTIGLGHGGALPLRAAKCPPWPRFLVVQQTEFRPTLVGQKVLADGGAWGRLVKIPPGPPRVLGLVRAPCSPNVCFGNLEVGLFNKAPAKVGVTFGPATAGETFRVAIGKKQRTLGAGHDNSFTFNVASGPRTLVVPVSWNDTLDAPRLKRVVLESGGTSARLW
jgi:hypothetical protein